MPAIDSFECGITFAHVFVRLVDFINGIHMYPLELNIVVCSQFAGDGGCNFGAMDFVLILAFEFVSRRRDRVC